MATKDDQRFFECSGCESPLEFDSKTFPCLHSLCGSCAEVVLGGDGLCPQCQRRVTGDRLRLSPFLAKPLRRRHLQSCEWSCELCSEDGIESGAQIWCHDCEKLLCNNCNRGHKKWQPTHNWEDLQGVSRVEAIRVITTDECRRHRQPKDAFCERCNVCVCDACYADHVTASPQCPARPLSAREEASKWKMIRGPTLERNLRELEIRIRAANERTRRSIDQLSRDCDCKSSKLWQDFEAFMEETRRKLGKLCDDMRAATSEQERKWRLTLRERDALLDKVEIWRHTLRRLLRDDTVDEDVVCGLRLVRAELSSRLLRQSFSPSEKGHLVVTFPKWCHDSLESLRKEAIDLTLETSGHFQLERECRLPGSNLVISSMVASDEDGHVFVADFHGRSIAEFGETGELVGRCPLTDGGKEFTPRDMCRLSEQILVVCGLEFLRRGEGGGNIWGSGRLFFLERKKSPPFLEIQKIITRKKNPFFSLCQIEKKIFVSVLDFDEIICFNENGEEIKTIRLGVSPGSRPYATRLRADPTTGNLWGARRGMSEIFVWNQNGEILQKLEIKEKILDFCSNNFGHFYFSTREGIFSLLPQKLLYKFPKRSENSPKIFVSPQKLFVYLKNNGENLLKIFKIN